jgi:tetratricopeptide (TPR) repeat protein
LCAKALTRLQQLEDRLGQARAWDSLGFAHRGLTDYTQAIICYQHAIDLYRELGDRPDEADSLAELGNSHHAAGHEAAARQAWHAALRMLDELHHPDADRVRGQLARW